MLIPVHDFLPRNLVHHCRERLAAADWQDGATSAGSLARAVKHNQQLAEDAPVALELGELLLRRLGEHPLFLSAALPKRIHPPRFNRYADGGTYGTHVDGALMRDPRDAALLRTDLSATLFLAEPEDYDGGELEIETTFGLQSVKMAAGDLVVYSSSSLHRVTPVTRGERIAAFFWLESVVRDDGERLLLFDLDQTIQALTPTLRPDDSPLLKLTAVYHNLLRRWAAT